MKASCCARGVDDGGRGGARRRRRPEPHVRALDLIASAALDPRPRRSRSGSAQLVDELQASDVIVHVVASPSLPHRHDGDDALRRADRRRALRAHRPGVAGRRPTSASRPSRTSCSTPARWRSPTPDPHDAVRALYRAIGDAGAGRPRRLRDRRAPAGPAPRCGPNCAAAAGQAARRPNSEPRLTGNVGRHFSAATLAEREAPPIALQAGRPGRRHAPACRPAAPAARR